MAITAHNTIVGLFDERGLADKAVNDLEQAGFTSGQIYYSGRGENPQTDFWHGVRRFFAHENTATQSDLDHELKNLGFSSDELDYYRRQFELGRTVVAIKAPGRENEASAILLANGAHG